MRSLMFSLVTFAFVVTASRLFYSDDRRLKNAPQTAHPNRQNVAQIFPVANMSVVSSEELDLLCQGSWKVFSITSNCLSDTNEDGHFTYNVGDEMPSCALDDIMVFNRDGVVTFERNERCDPAEKAIEKYNWFYRPGLRKLYLARGSVEAVMVLRSVSEHLLIVETQGQDRGFNHIFTVTYVHPAPVYP